VLSSDGLDSAQWAKAFGRYQSVFFSGRGFHRNDESGVHPPMADTGTIQDAAPARRRRMPATRIYKRSIAAALAGYTVRTLDRRERTDPNIPKRVALGPGGGPPYGYVATEWDAYLANLQRVERPEQEQQEVTDEGQQ